jgi:hypothetical protein
MSVLNHAHASYELALFALEVLRDHILTFFDFWSPEDQFSFVEWLHSLMFSRPELFVHDHILRVCGTILGVVISNTWTMTKRVKEILDSDFEQFSPERPNRPFLSLLSSIARQKIAHFRTEYLSQCLG